MAISLNNICLDYNLISVLIWFIPLGAYLTCELDLSDINKNKIIHFDFNSINNDTDNFVCKHCHQ